MKLQIKKSTVRYISDILCFYFVVQSGFCRVTKLPHAKAARSLAVDVQSNVTVNSVLGEVSLRNNTTATASVLAKGPVKVYSFSKSIFQRYLYNSSYLQRLVNRRSADNIKTLKTSSLTNLKYNDFIWEHPLVCHRELCSVRLVCHQATAGKSQLCTTVLLFCCNYFQLLDAC